MFDAVLDRSNVPKSRFGTGATASVLLHVGLLGFALWITSRPPAEKKQELAVKFMVAPPPPPPPPPPPAKPKPKTEIKKPTPKPDVILQPKEIPSNKPAEAEPEENKDDEGVEGGVEGGVKGGVVGGVLGGVLGGQLGGTGTEVLPFGEGMTRPEKIEGRDVQYTREALEAHIEGIMLVKCVITLQGRLENCRILKPRPHMEKAVLDALATWRYKPVTFQGRPVAVEYIFTVRLVIPR